MAFKAKHMDAPTKVGVDLTKDEVEVVLQMVKGTTFSGELLEPLYNLVVKLQKYHQKL